MNTWIAKIPQRYWAYMALAMWAMLAFMLLHKTSYGIDEGAAQALLLVWSVADDVVSPVVTMGFPDFRTVFFAPIAFLWPGSVIAAKIATLLVMSVMVWSLYRWRQREGDNESVLIATGLILLAPLTLQQIDTISVAPYLFITFVFGAWMNQSYRESPLPFGGVYFAQLFLCFFSVTLHPVGLAYPLVLLWAWYHSPIDKNQRNYFLGGVGAAVVLALLLTMGWQHVVWFANPIKILSTLFLGSATGSELGVSGWLAAIGGLTLLLFVVWTQIRELWADFFGKINLVALAIGVLIGDEIFAMVALLICLYWGLPVLLRDKQNLSGGFWRQRGFALLLVVLISTVFMINGKARYLVVESGYLAARDQLLKDFTENKHVFSVAADAQDSSLKKVVRVASQWPAQTMLACRCDALPLPPNVKDSDALFAMLKGVDYLMFDPRNPANAELSRNMAMMGAERAETIVLQQGGVVVEVKNAARVPQESAK